MHIEVHYCATARDAALLGQAGLPRYDLEGGTCGACKARIAEVENLNGKTVGWRPFGVVLTGELTDVLCARCLRPVLRLTTAA